MTPEDLKLLPDKPGVYLMKDVNGKIIYVGKAISLKNRVRSYFQSSRNLSPRIQNMVNLVDRVEYITTASEVEALILECNFIKEEHPKYNIRLRDDKQYPWVKITLAERFPQVYITRKLKKDGSKYYGPYTSVSSLRETFRLIRQIFPLRSCRHDLDREKVERPCLNYHIHRCLAPCAGEIDQAAYREMIHQVCTFLEGRRDELAAKLEQAMKEAADQREYEKAARLRDQLMAIRRVLEKQKVVSDSGDDSDVFGLAQDRQGTVVQVFQVRGGKLVGREYFALNEGVETPAAEVLESFIPQYYDGSGFIPRHILLSAAPEGLMVIKEMLSAGRGGTVDIKIPQKGEKLKLLQMAAENAQMLLETERHKESMRESQAQETLAELQAELAINKLPLRIEGFDISNIQGQQPVAAMVVFENGVPKGADYRRFKIKTIAGPNDFAMLQEAVRRRFLKGLAERQETTTAKGKFAKFPDLLLIDGGKGQLSGVCEVLAELGLEHIPVIGLAKQEEAIFLPDRRQPLMLSRHSKALRLLQRIRDEAHRFAITYHKNLRDKSTVQSGLDKIAGLGPKRKQLLLKTFGSVKRIQEASLEDLAKVPGMNLKIAARIKEHLSYL